MNFKNRTSDPERFTTEAGRKYANTYEITIDKNGHKTLNKTGETNTYAMIQEYLEESKIENILKRATEDPTVLEAANGQYIDCTEMPTTLAEAQNLIIRLNTEFDSLPIETKKKFDMSAEKYVAEYGNENWAKAMNMVVEKVEEAETKIEKKEKEVTENE